MPKQNVLYLIRYNMDFIRSMLKITCGKTQITAFNRRDVRAFNSFDIDSPKLYTMHIILIRLKRYLKPWVFIYDPDTGIC